MGLEMEVDFRHRANGACRSDVRGMVVTWVRLI